MKFDIRVFFEKSVEDIQVSLKGDKNNQRTFLISCSFLLRMRNVSDKDCGEYQNIHCRFKNVFKNRSVGEIMWIQYCGAGRTGPR
jgi:hypothetical protein